MRLLLDEHLDCRLKHFSATDSFAAVLSGKKRAAIVVSQLPCPDRVASLLSDVYSVY